MDAVAVDVGIVAVVVVEGVVWCCWLFVRLLLFVGGVTAVVMVVLLMMSLLLFSRCSKIGCGGKVVRGEDGFESITGTL